MSGHNITKKSTAAFAFAGMGFSLIYTFWSQFSMLFFTDVAMITPAAIGLMILFARIWDAVNDPMMGIIVDKTKTKYGKARPYVFIGAFLSSILLILTFTCVGDTEKERLIWASVTYIGFSMAFTVVSIAYFTLIPRASNSISDTMKLNSANNIGQATAGIAGGLLIVPSIKYFTEKFDGSGDKAYLTLALFIGLFALVGFLTLFFCVKERKDVELNIQKSKHSLSEIITSLFKNKPFLKMFLIVIVNYCVTGLIGGFMLYYYIYAIKRIDLLPIVAALNGVALLTINAFLPKIVSKLKMERKYLLAIAGCIGVVVSIPRLIMGDTSTAAIIVLEAIRASGYALTYSVLVPMLVDTIDYGELKTGVRADGLVMSSLGFNAKLSAGITGVVAGYVLQATNYIPNGAQQTEAFISAMGFGYFLPVIISGILIAALAMTIKVTDQEMLEAKLALQRKNQIEGGAINA